MQTKSEIQQKLACHGLRPNKKLGQNFLIDLNTMRLFIDRADVTKNDLVLEVGPGTGSMTESLCDLAGHVIAVEYDKGLAQLIKQLAETKNNLTVIQGDALKNQNAINENIVDELEKQRKLFPGKVMLVSNLPYDISSALIINLILGPAAIDEMYITVQREIAEKIIAKPNTSLYGTLSIFAQATGVSEIFHKLSPNVFWPPPKVDSAMLEYKKQSQLFDSIENKKVFQQTVGMFFQHRRKTIKACTKFAPDNLKATNWSDIFAQLNIEPRLRPENLSSTDFVQIANLASQDIITK